MRPPLPASFATFVAFVAFFVASFVARPASAFCGFYVAPSDGPLVADASEVSLMRDGTRTVLSMSTDYRGPAKDFAMVVPVPVVLQKDDVKTLPHDVFHKLETLTSPRLVEYWEHNPCDNPCADADPGTCGFGYGSGSGYGYGKGSLGSVSIEAQFAVGEYDIVILGAKDSDGLEAWLHDHGYAIPKGASAALAPYVKEGMKFFVAKVDVKKVKLDAKGVAELSPLRISYESENFRLPVRLGLLNAPAGKSGKQDLIVWILSTDHRYEVSNLPNLFVPTNLEVADATRKQFASFYAEIFDKTLEAAGGKGVVTEYAWESSSCDPCPTPPMTDDEIATLGGDAVWPEVIYSPDGSKKTTRMKGRHSMVLTRLHARYDAASLSDDLVFEVASPITGGREGDGAAPTASTYNNYQARYVIRHGWAGAIKCKNPLRGEWDASPAGKEKPKPGAATQLAFAPRGEVKLASLLTNGMPNFSIAAPTAIEDADAGAGADVDASTDASEDANAGADAGAGADAIVDDASFGGVPQVQPGPHGCGCEIVGADVGASSLGFGVGLVVASALFERRRRRHRNASQNAGDSLS
jgi:hypothetical protein